MAPGIAFLDEKAFYIILVYAPKISFGHFFEQPYLIGFYGYTEPMLLSRSKKR